jgi:hypothetical protein
MLTKERRINRSYVLHLMLLLCGAMSEAVGQLPPAPPALPPDVNDPPSTTGVAKELAEIQDWPRWSKMAQDGDSFMLGIQFDGWTRVVIQLSRLDRRDEVDRLCDAIIALHGHLPENSVQPHGNIAAISFVRDAFRIGSRRVEVGQYWGPERDDSIDLNQTKLYRFSVLDGKDVVLHYFLEHSRRSGQDFYALDKIDPRTRAHDRVRSYGAAAPTYWTLLRDVLRDINDPNPPKALY